MKTFILLIMLNTCIIASSQRSVDSSRKIFEAPTNPIPICEGSLLIEAEDGSRHIIRDSIDATNIIVRSVTADGCGCFRVHSRKYGRGIKNVIFSSSGTQDWIGFRRIKSIYKIDCSVYDNA